MSTEPFKILGREIKKGESAFLELEVAKQHTRNSLKIPIIIERAKREGPTLLLMGGVHGDEVNGVAVVRDIILKNYNKPRKGTVICIPVFNVFGYLNMSRKFPDGRDLNRVFPGSAKGSLASQFANAFTREIAPLVDYILDFHTGGADRENFPNIRCVIQEPETVALAKVFGAPFIVNSAYIPKSIRYTMYKMGKKILLFEGGKSLSLDKSVIDAGVEGALNVMKYLGMQKGNLRSRHKTIIISKSKWIRAPHSGMFESRIKNGIWVSRRTILGRITDPYGEFEKSISAPFDGYVIGLNTAPIVHKGDALFHVGYKWE